MPRARQPHRAAPPLARRQRLPAAATRWPGGVPAALRPRPPAGRHHRHRLPWRSGALQRAAVRGGLPVRCRQPLPA
ncbi:hypothetical protein G6F59_017673 [Rhizopus arrhizus]|nr:hypothetical protein G6F59_017673 [Rhizopus arrhizus]